MRIRGNRKSSKSTLISVCADVVVSVAAAAASASSSPTPPDDAGAASASLFDDCFFSFLTFPGKRMRISSFGSFMFYYVLPSTIL